MSAKRLKLMDQIRHAIDGSGMSRYALCKQIRMSQATMSRFMHGHGGLSVEKLDEIGEALELNITAGVTARKGKGR
jgi:transcriptional regulator with XRE-family HTH domain